MATYVLVNINTKKAPHFAIWYHNRTSSAMPHMTAAVMNYAIKRQFLRIGSISKDATTDDLPDTFQIRLKNNECITQWETQLKMMHQKKRQLVEYILEQSISTEDTINYVQAEMEIKIEDLRIEAAALQAGEKSTHFAQPENPVNITKSQNKNISDYRIEAKTGHSNTEEPETAKNPKDTETSSSIVIEKKKNDDNLFLNDAFAGLE